jgi:hypothetical protein
LRGRHCPVKNGGGGGGQFLKKGKGALIKTSMGIRLRLHPPPPPSIHIVLLDNESAHLPPTFQQAVTTGGQVGHAIGAVHDPEGARREELEGLGKHHVPHTRLSERIQQRSQAEADAQVGRAERGCRAACSV